MRRALIGMFILILLPGLMLRELDRRWHRPLDLPAAGYYFTVGSGESLGAVARHLQQSAVLPDPFLLNAYGRLSGLDLQVKRGEYLLKPPATMRTLLTMLSAGKVIQYRVTFPEGITLDRAITLLAGEEKLERVLTGSSDPRIIALVAPRVSGEGLLFPDSYQYERGSSDWQIVQRAHRRMQSVLADEWRDKAENTPYETPYEALIMASIVERETGLPRERAQIAGVFVRRLLLRMQLQTDPTVIYGLGPDFDGNLRRHHLRNDSNPYNTYRHRGLPPTPIALPGREAIHAALHPAEGDTLYFVARGDGGHQFSTTLNDHLAAVRKYQLSRSKDYRSTPE
ncbi:MAG: endolytic transglycosylase MltG [Halieaceae bacterium]|jgi:UPF0755 protein|nr:endolytic transglycosylase MltG [Halieaceae bacterium]